MRRLWLLSEQAWREVRLGPLERMLSFARLGLEEDMEVHLAVDGIHASPIPGVVLEPLEPGLLRRIGPGDAVIASIFLPPRVLFALLRSDIAFHADFYCVSALEGMESLAGLGGSRILRGRRRTVARYRMLSRRAEALYFSNVEQIEFVGGALFAGSRESDPRWISRLPAKTIVAPMGVRPGPFPTGNPWPFPEELKGRPVYLWGGGIWHWFDVSSLLEAFSILQREGDAATLYFLVSRNPSLEKSQDAAPGRAIAMARDLGLLGRSVHFHDRPVVPADLPGFLEHSTAGILSNARNLESLASWRTRYLDLLWAGKPLLVHRPDALALRLEKAGAALVNHRGGAADLAALVARFHGDRDLRDRMSGAAMACREGFSEGVALGPVRDRLRNRAWTEIGRKPSAFEILAYAAGA